MNDPLKFDPSIQSENIAFDKADLVACRGCGRTNPPNRLKCIYCGHELEVDASSDIEANFRILETWERGFNVIVTAGEPTNIAAAARTLGREPSEVKTVLEGKQPLPISRVESEKEAAFLQNRLQHLGVSCTIVSDRDLAADKPPVRVGSIDVLADRVVFNDFNTGRSTSVAASDIGLVVTGSITQSRVDSIEKKGRGKSATLDESSAVTDEPVVDIYSRLDPVGFRVYTTGFDFSCLGEDKGLIAAENLRTLVVYFSEIAPGVKLVTNYMSARAALTHVWPVEMRNDPKGLRNVRFGKRGFAATATSDNRDQFNRYSRLQWHLL